MNDTKILLTNALRVLAELNDYATTNKYNYIDLCAVEACEPVELPTPAVSFISYALATAEAYIDIIKFIYSDEVTDIKTALDYMSYYVAGGCCEIATIGGRYTIIRKEA